jgi:hypothetical protein
LFIALKAALLRSSAGVSCLGRRGAVGADDGKGAMKMMLGCIQFIYIIGATPPPERKVEKGFKSAERVDNGLLAVFFTFLGIT